MCSETFLRLPEEKRNRFLNAAWEEFGRTSFADASINQIVQRAGVPRGSFYQYFADKEDLFAYLQEIVLEHLISEYRAIMIQADGDIFKAQLICFDRIANFGSAADILFDRCIRVLRLNPGLLPQAATRDQLMCRVIGSVQDQIDVTHFRCREQAFVIQTFALSLVSLAAAVMECLETPENAAEHRRVLLIRLEIIQNGSLKPDVPAAG